MSFNFSVGTLIEKFKPVAFEKQVPEYQMISIGQKNSKLPCFCTVEFLIPESEEAFKPFSSTCLKFSRVILKEEADSVVTKHIN